VKKNHRFSAALLFERGNVQRQIADCYGQIAERYAHGNAMKVRFVLIGVALHKK
jgi:hypothetical protein